MNHATTTEWRSRAISIALTAMVLLLLAGMVVAWMYRPDCLLKVTDAATRGALGFPDGIAIGYQTYFRGGIGVEAVVGARHDVRTQPVTDHWPEALELLYAGHGDSSCGRNIDPSAVVEWYISPGDRFQLRAGDEVPVCRCTLQGDSEPVTIWLKVIRFR